MVCQGRGWIALKPAEVSCRRAHLTWSRCVRQHACDAPNHLLLQTACQHQAKAPNCQLPTVEVPAAAAAAGRPSMVPTASPALQCQLEVASLQVSAKVGVQASSHQCMYRCTSRRQTDVLPCPAAWRTSALSWLVGCSKHACCPSATLVWLLTCTVSHLRLFASRACTTAVPHKPQPPKAAPADSFKLTGASNGQGPH